MAARHSYLFHILSFLHDSPEAQDVERVFRHLEQARLDMEREEPFNLHIPSGLSSLEDVLQSLAEIGVLRAGQNLRADPTWTLATPRVERGRGNDEGAGGGDRGGGGRDGPGNGDQEGQGGGGLAEVLSHPVLFCLPDDAQDLLVLQALGPLAGPDGQDEGSLT